MKKTMAKRKILGIASVVCAGFALAGVCTLPTTDVLAEYETANVSSETFVSTDGATASYTSYIPDKANFSVDGVAVVSDTAYTGKIDGTFTGSTSLQYYLGDGYYQAKADNATTYTSGNHGHGSPYGDFKFYVTNAANSADVITIGFQNMPASYQMVLPYITYQGKTRWLRGTLIPTDIALPNNNTNTFSHYAYGAQGAGFLTTLAFTWDEGVFEIWQTQGKATGCLARFDGTDNVANNSTAITEGTKKYHDYGLPTVDFSQGYTISFASSFATSANDKGTDVVFTNIGGYSLQSETVSVQQKAGEVSFFHELEKDENGQKVITVAKDDELAKPIYGSTQDIAVSAVKNETSLSGVFTKNVGEEAEFDFSDTSKVGEKTITASYEDNAQEYLLKVLPKFDASVVSTTSEGIDVSYKEMTFGSATESGLVLSSESAYEAAFKGAFYGNKEFAFRFTESNNIPNTDWTGNAYGHGFGNFYFEIADAKNPTEDNTFQIVIASSGNESTSKVQDSGTMEVYYKGNRYWMNATAGANFGVPTSTPGGNGIPCLAYGFGSGTNASAINKISLKWEDEVLGIYTYVKQNRTTEVALAKFDGTSIVGGTGTDKSTWTYGLPRISYPNGYTVKFGSDIKSALSESTLTSLERTVADWATDVFFEMPETYEFDTTVEYNGEMTDGKIELPANGTVDSFTTRYTHQYAQNWKFTESVQYQETIDLDTSVSGTQTLTLIVPETEKYLPFTTTYTVVVGEVVTPDLGDELELIDVSLNGKLKMKVVMSFPDDLISGVAVLKTWIGDVAQADIALNTLTANTDGKYEFYFELAAAEMTKKVSLQVVNGEVEGEKYAYSVRDYAEGMLSLSTTTDEQKTMIKAMLNYGAEAQKHFDANANDLANSILDEADKSLVYEDSAMTADTEVIGLSGVSVSANLFLESDSTLRIYFESTESYTYILNDGTKDYKLVSVVDGNRTYVEIPNISASKLDVVYTITVKDATGTEIGSVVTSALAYATVLNSTNSSLAKALYLYNVAANALFE